MTEIDRYPAQVSWSDDDEGFIALAPDLPGCSAFGETQAEALAELQPAIRAWIEAAQAAGNQVPEPSALAQPDDFSGKLLVRMPRSLHAKLSREAAAENVSLNQYVVVLLAERRAERAVRAAARSAVKQYITLKYVDVKRETRELIPAHMPAVFASWGEGKRVSTRGTYSGQKTS